MERLAVCNKTILLDFAVHNAIDRKDGHITIRACTKSDKDTSIPSPISFDSSLEFPQKEVTFQVGSWGHANTSVAGAIAGLDQIQQYLVIDGFPNAAIIVYLLFSIQIVFANLQD